eukprot:scaffold64737_cov53-Phaeocystis_antarctica.AAC.4
MESGASTPPLVSTIVRTVTWIANCGTSSKHPLYGEGDVGQGVTRREQRAENVRTRQLDSDLGVGGKAQHGHG